METAEVDPLQFNEFVSKRIHNRAPSTEAGKSRRFRENVLVGLWWFSKMMDEGIKAERAAAIACRFVEHAADLWPDGGAPEPDWIREHVDAIFATLTSMLRLDGRDVRRLPHRLH